MSGVRWLREGYACHQAGDLAAAAQHYRRATRDIKVKADALHGLGLVELQRGRADAAIEALEPAVGLAPRNPAILTNLGHALMAARRPAEATTALRRAAALAPQAETLFNLAFAEQAAGRPLVAEDWYRKTLELEPDHAGALNNLAGLLHSLGRVANAIGFYRRALALAPGDPEVRLNLARALEISGDLEEAGSEAQRLEKARPQDPRPRLLRARIARRKGDTDSAESLLRPLLAEDLADDEACSARKELALVCDQRGASADAFALVEEGNRYRRRQAQRQGLDGRDWLDRIGGYRDVFTAARLAAAPPAAVDDRLPPIFFVGFPRSGTTLMETILATHPDLVTSGEITPLDQVLTAIAPSGLSTDILDALAQLDEDGLAALRAEFWGAAEALFPDLKDGKRLVDKAPFNLVELGLINLLFPAAPVIVAGRDPRDVCLSCFFQDFALSDAVVNFLDIADTARAYMAVDALWQHYRQVLTLPWLSYRYEELVADPSAVAARVFAFLGLTWQKELMQRRGQPSATQFIATPSRDAVARPITTAAVARWRRYELEMAPALKLLQPAVTAMGYDTDAHGS